jgi:hypothetical protein
VHGVLMSVRPAENPAVGGRLQVVAELDDAAQGAVDVATAYVVGLLRSGSLIRAGLKTVHKQLCSVSGIHPFTLTFQQLSPRCVPSPARPVALSHAQTQHAMFTTFLVLHPSEPVGPCASTLPAGGPAACTLKPPPAVVGVGRMGRR